MKIVLLCGSPRAHGNSAAMANAFEAAALTAGHTLHRFDTSAMQIAPCTACMRCYSKGSPCVISDDFNKIAEATLEADLIVFVCPVYWYGMPAQLKAVMDRFYCFLIGKKELKGKKWALLSCCEDEDDSVFDAIRIALKKSAEYLGWRCVGEILVSGVFAPGDILKTDGCERSAALAREIETIC